MRMLLVSLLAALSIGCASLPASTGSRGAWIRAQGGLDVAPSLHARARVALGRLAPHCACGSPRVSVLASDRIDAFAFPDGDLYVTRGLVRLLGDDGLLAALAHELGHVDGSRRGQPDEEQADLRGLALLRAAGLPAAEMSRMMATVRPRSDARGASALAHREAALALALALAAPFALGE